MTIRYVRPVATGTASGTSWSNAGGPGEFGSLFAQRVPGDEVWLEAPGFFGLSIGKTLNSANAANGSPSVRIEVKGMFPVGTTDGVPADAVCIGNRSDPWVPGGVAGATLFGLQASYTWFRNIVARNWGKVFHLDDTIAGNRILDCKAHNVDHFIEQNAAFTPTALRVERCSVHGHAGKFARMKGDANNLRFVDCQGFSQAQDDDSNDFPGGIVLGTSGGTVHNVLCLRCHFEGGYDYVSGGAYRNGDGFTSEEDCYSISWFDCSAKGFTDGGWDVKSYGSTLDRCLAADNKRNFRAHYVGGLSATFGLLMRNCVSLDPRHRGGSGNTSHLLLDSGVPGHPGCKVTARGCVFRSSEGGPKSYVIEFTENSGSELLLSDTDIYRPSDLTEVLNSGSNVYSKTRADLYTDVYE